MIPDIEALLLKQNKEPKDYQLLLGYFWFIYCSNPTDKDTAILKQLASHYEEKFKRKVLNLSIFKNNILATGLFLSGYDK